MKDSSRGRSGPPPVSGDRGSFSDKPKGPGFPLWILAVIIPAGGAFVLCCCGGIAFVAYRGGPDRPAPAQPDMTLAAYLAQRPDAPTKIAVECKLDNYYNFDYRNAAGSHYSVSLLSRNPVKVGHAWVPKDSDAGRQVFEALKDGRERRLTIEVVLQGPNGAPTPPGREEMAIVKVVK